MKVYVLFALLFLLLAPNVLSLGLAYEYLENRTLRLTPGENYYFKLMFQNDQKEEITIGVTLDSDIATLLGGEKLIIPPMNADLFVYFNITIPPTASKGTEYRVHYTVAPIESDQEGPVPFIVKYDRTLRILIVEGEETPSQEPPGDVADVELEKKNYFVVKILFSVLILILVALLLTFLWRRSDLLSKKLKKMKWRRKKPSMQKAKILEKKVKKASPQSTTPKKEMLSSPSKPTLRLKNGMELRSLRDLLYALEYMDEKTFAYHFNGEHNDFSEWVKSFGKKGIALKLSAVKSQKHMVQVLKNELS